MLVGIDFLPVKPAALLRNRLAEAGLSPGHSILIPSASHGLLGRGENLLRRVEIREPLRQQDRSLVKCITCNGADHRFLKILKPVCSVIFHGRLIYVKAEMKQRCYSKSTEATAATKGWLNAITF